MHAPCVVQVLRPLAPLWAADLPPYLAAAAVAAGKTQRCHGWTPTAPYMGRLFSASSKFNTGVMLLRPNASVYAELVAALGGQLAPPLLTCTDGSQTLWSRVLRRRVGCLHASFNCIHLSRASAKVSAEKAWTRAHTQCTIRPHRAPSFRRCAADFVHRVCHSQAWMYLSRDDPNSSLVHPICTRGYGTVGTGRKYGNASEVQLRAAAALAESTRGHANRPPSLLSHASQRHIEVPHVVHFAGGGGSRKPWALPRSEHELAHRLWVLEAKRAGAIAV